MDDMDKKEMQEQEGQKEVTEEVEEEVTEEVTGEVAEEVEEEVTEEVTEEVAEETKANEKKGTLKHLFTMFLCLLAFLAFLAVIWFLPFSDAEKQGVFYTKENDLYFSDFDAEPHLVHENIAGTGSYHYYYAAWGADVSKNGATAYYGANVNEAGAFDLYRKPMTDLDKEGEWIDTNVIAYTCSEDGKVLIYAKTSQDGVQLYTHEDGEPYLVSEILFEENMPILISDDGKFIVYMNLEKELILETVGQKETQKVLAKQPINYVMAEEDSIIYYVEQDAEGHHLYGHTIAEGKTEHIASNVTSMQMMPNEKDILYGVNPKDTIAYSELILDDMAETDAAIEEGDEGYAQKQKRDQIREAMKNGEGIQPLMTEYYLLSQGEKIFLEDHAISAVAIDDENDFIVGYRAKDIQPIPLSVITGGVEMVETIYYMALQYEGIETFLVDKNGVMTTIQDQNILPETVTISQDGRKIAYLKAKSAENNSYDLMLLDLDHAGSAKLIQENVFDFAFIGENGLLCYCYADENGMGYLASTGSDKVITDVYFAELNPDMQNIYYIANVGAMTTSGQLCHWNGKGNPVVVDGGVSTFHPQSDNSVIIVYQYDEVEQVFDLGVYDGSGVTIIDEDVTAFYLY